MSKTSKEQKTKKKREWMLSLDVYEEAASPSSSSSLNHIFLFRPSIVRKPTSIVPPILAHIPFLACPPDWVSWSVGVVPLTHRRTTRPAWKRNLACKTPQRRLLQPPVCLLVRYARDITSYQVLGAATKDTKLQPEHPSLADRTDTYSCVYYS